MPDPLVHVDLGQLMRDFPEPVLVVDPSGTILVPSPAAVRLLGAGGPLPGRPISSLFSDDAAERALAETLEAFRRGSGENASRSLRAWLTDPEGGRREVDVTVWATPTAGSDVPFLVVNVHGMAAPPVQREADEVWRYFDAALDLSHRIGAAASEEEAFAAILPTILSGLSWDVAGLWVLTGDGRYLVCAETWPDPPSPCEVFQEASRAVRLRVGQGLPGSAWSSGRPLVSGVAVGEAKLLRQEAIQECGLTTGLAFPLNSRAGPVGVIEMFSRESLAIPPRLLEALVGLGRQVGELIQHFRDERRLREEERLRSFLFEASTVLSESSDYGDALRKLAAVAVPEMADLCLIDVKETDSLITRMAAVHADPAKAALVEELGARYPPAPAGVHPSTEVIQTGVSSFSPTMSEDFLRRTTRDERHFQIVRELGFESYMCVPLKVGDEVLGAITLVSAGSGRRFRSSDLALPEQLADRAANLIASARRHEHEHQLAMQFQKLLLPERLPDVPGYDLCVRYSAATPQADTGGDFYDVVMLPSERLGFVIGDVEGHDPVAAATMGQLRSATRALAGQVREPGELVDALRWSWKLLGFERFATALFARLDPESGEVVMASAGHLPPVHVDAGSVARFVQVEPSAVLGAMGSPCREYAMKVAPGETLFLYTDGLVEDRVADIDDRLSQMLAPLQQHHDALDELCEQMITTFAPPYGGRRDDIAILAIKRHGV